ncbi:hypothetical protein [Chitinophaga sp. 212800010-3]|uniref:hypothetical protein n=1 Tax=unclassified Chitinophaga TaxID=2619133 RepID=UPI002DE93D5F|nr:DUF1735 domain-containing protein [Chitinophaga sp. 212800010-3]
MKRWIYLPLLFLVAGFILPGCTKKYTETVIPSTTILYDINPGDWGYDATNDLYFYSIATPELKGIYQTDAVVVSIARFPANSTQEPNPFSFELLPQVYGGQSYFIIHNDAAVEVDIKGVDGNRSAKPATRVRVKIVITPSVQR